MDQPLFSLPLAFPKRKRLPARQLVQGNAEIVGKGAEHGKSRFAFSRLITPIGAIGNTAMHGYNFLT